VAPASAKAFGACIREARIVRCERMPLEQFGRQLAAKLGRQRPFSNVTVSNWETGRQEPNWAALVAIACLTHLPLEYFAGIGSVQEYPAERWQAHPDRGLDSRLVSAATAVQRLGPELQALVLNQVEVLVESLLDRR
jgi:transcriptional regulator with XRE-family HTH domain